MKEAAFPSIRLRGALEKNQGKGKVSGRPHKLSFLSAVACDSLECDDPDHFVGMLVVQLAEPMDLASALENTLSFATRERVLELAIDAFPRFFPSATAPRPARLGFSEYALFFQAPLDRKEELFSNYVAFRFYLLEQTGKILQHSEQTPQLLVGYAPLGQSEELDLESRVFQAFCEGRQLGRAKIDPQWFAMRAELTHIIRERKVSILYQPVVDFRNGAVLGWEALARGPRESLLHMPTNLFAFAEEMGEAYELDRLCRVSALRGLGGMELGQKLFLNLHPHSLFSAGLAPETLLDEAREVGLEGRNLVIEIPEHGILADINLFLKKIDQYREAGFLLAIHDIGAANSSLRALSLIRPDYIKVDGSLVCNVDSNPFKRVMLESLTLLSEKLGCKVIAEGVETDTEFSSLVSMGVHAGQGFFFGELASNKPLPIIALPAKVGAEEVQNNVWNCSIPMRKLAQPAFIVGADQTIQEVKELVKDKPPLSSVVVVEKERPLGLIMNYNLDRHLSTQYGLSLYYSRSATRLMDTAPLVVDADCSVESVAKQAMNRESEKIYDDIIVIDPAGVLLGIVSVQKMLDTLAQVHVELAKGSNPLTGLPGNVSIEMEITLRAKNQTPSSLIYVDLDNFKVYNDVYGFANGDRVILLTSKVLREAVNACDSTAFLGHVGGDDFMVISAPEAADCIGARVVQAFEREAPAMYNEQDREAGFVLAKGRDGVMAKFPFVSLSLGVIDCLFAFPFSSEELSRRTAEVKKFAKSKPGNSYVRDRRAPLGAQPDASGLSQEQGDSPRLSLLRSGVS